MSADRFCCCRLTFEQRRALDELAGAVGMDASDLAGALLAEALAGRFGVVDPDEVGMGDLAAAMFDADAALVRALSVCDAVIEGDSFGLLGALSAALAALRTVARENPRKVLVTPSDSSQFENPQPEAGGVAV